MSAWDTIQPVMIGSKPTAISCPFNNRRYIMRQLFLDLLLAIALGLAFASLALAYFDVLI
jgi:hypothetical protein